jgi:DNA-directed RNA polymerase specialized sigma24 family protein
MKKERPPTDAEFQKLLTWLDGDPDLAGKKYQTLHLRLTRIFITRGCLDAEELADEVMNRVGVRIDEIVKTYEGDPGRCLHGFAKRVWQEYARDQRVDSLDDVQPPSVPADDEREMERQQKCEQEDDCLSECMSLLMPVDGDLFRRYFQDEKRAQHGRQRLAADLRITANALRIKAYRIRRRLRRCMEACLKRVPESETITT